MLKLCEVVHEPKLKGCVVCCPVDPAWHIRSGKVHTFSLRYGWVQWMPSVRKDVWRDVMVRSTARNKDCHCQDEPSQMINDAMIHDLWRTMNEEWCIIVWCILCMLHVHVDIKSSGHRHIVFPPYLSDWGGTWPVGVYLRSAWEGLSDLGRFSWNVSVSTLKIGERDLRDEKGPASECTEWLKRDWFFWGECKIHVSIWSWYMIGVILEL